MAQDNIGVPRANIPVPDPSLLTTEQSNRLRIELMIYIEGQISILNERILASHLTPTEGSIRELTHLKELTLEKFTAVDERFRERDIRGEREARDNKVAVDAAFAAQKEAVSEQNKSNALAISKSEAATSEAINKLGEASEASRNALGDKIEDVKALIAATERNLGARIATVELAVNGDFQNRKGGQQANATTIALILLLIAVVGLGFTIATKLH